MDTWMRHFVFDHWCLRLHWTETFRSNSHRWWHQHSTYQVIDCNLCFVIPPVPDRLIRKLKKKNYFSLFNLSYNIYLAFQQQIVGRTFRQLSWQSQSHIISLGEIRHRKIKAPGVEKQKRHKLLTKSVCYVCVRAPGIIFKNFLNYWKYTLGDHFCLFIHNLCISVHSAIFRYILLCVKNFNNCDCFLHVTHMCTEFFINNGGGQRRSV